MQPAFGHMQTWVASKLHWQRGWEQHMWKKHGLWERINNKKSRRPTTGFLKQRRHSRDSWFKHILTLKLSSKSGDRSHRNGCARVGDGSEIVVAPQFFHHDGNYSLKPWKTVDSYSIETFKKGGNGMAEAKPINGRWDAFSTKWWPWSLLLLDAVTPTLLWSVLCCTRHRWKCRADTARSCRNPCRICWPESHTTGLPTANCCGRLYWEMLGPADLPGSSLFHLGYIPRNKSYTRSFGVQDSFNCNSNLLPTCPPKEVLHS